MSPSFDFVNGGVLSLNHLEVTLYMGHGVFLRLLVNACRGADVSMGLPRDQDHFWMELAAKFNSEIQDKWDGPYSEIFAKRMHKAYSLYRQHPDLANGDLMRFVKNHSVILSEIFSD
nr:hypothetical protein [Tanacetum cinerariifolium]